MAETKKILNILKDRKHTGLDELPKTIICFSHLRWDFVFQRPQHLLTRLSQRFSVYFIEEPVYDADKEYYSRSSFEM